MKLVGVENVINVIYLMCFAGSCASTISGIIEHSIGLMLLASPELLLVMIGIKYWPTYTEQRWEYLRTMLLGCILLLPTGIIMVAISNFANPDKVIIIAGLILVIALSIANLITIMAEFKRNSINGERS